MDALKNLIANVPDWLKRLDDLSNQIEQRQQELIKLAEKQRHQKDGNGLEELVTTQSMRNRGSTESLRPRDSQALPDTPQRAATSHGGSPRESTNAHPSLPNSAIPPAPPKRSPPPTPSNNKMSQDDPPAAPTRTPPFTPIARQHSSASASQQQFAPASPSAASATPSVIARQTSQVRAAGQARARVAAARKRQRAGSVPSVEGGAGPKYRTRSMIIVYYDSYVQSFFEELVKFISASRNMMRKAKMAAKVAQIRRMAELEIPDREDDEAAGASKDGRGEIRMEGMLSVSLAPLTPLCMTERGGAIGAITESGGSKPLLALSPAPLAAADATIEAATLEAGDDDDEEELPPLRYVSSRRMQPMSRTPNTLLTTAGRSPSSSRPTMSPQTPPPDIYDELDKGLEYVQSMCEHAAHQFLRDGDCTDDIGNIQRRFAETKGLADREMERTRREEPARLAAEEDDIKGRAFRPQTMRREHAEHIPLKETPTIAKAAGQNTVPGGVPFNGTLQVDEAIEVGNEKEDQDFVMPKLAYKSSRSRMMVMRG